MTKLALSHFNDIMFPFKKSCGYLRALVFRGSGGLPFLVHEFSRAFTTMAVPVATIKLEDSTFVFGVDSWLETIHGVFSNFNLSTGVEFVLYDYILSVGKPLHPVVSGHVFVSQLWSKIVVGKTTYKRTYRHGLTDGLKI